MSSCETALAAELRIRHHVTTTARLGRLGITQRVCDRLVRTGRLQRVARGVFVDAASPSTLEQRMAVACAITGGVVCFPTAGMLWELRKTPRGDEVHLWVPRGRRFGDHEGIAVHQTAELPSADIVARGDGISVTSPPRTVVDAAAWLRRDDLESLAEQCLDRYVSVAALEHVARRMCVRGRTGSGVLRALLAGRPSDAKPIDSDDELRLERAMRRRGFPPLVRQHRLQLDSGVVIHPDLGIPADRFFVEVDHRTWHGGRIESAYDSERDLDAGASGYHVERVSDLAIERHLDATVEKLWKIWQRLHAGSQP